MSSGTFKLRQVLPFILAFLCLHTASNFLPRSWSAEASYLFEILDPVFALAACCWRARSVIGRARVLWILLAIGLFFWTGGILLSAWEELFQHLSFQIAASADFVFFFYGVPILLALSTPVKGQRFLLFTWLNGIQAVFAGYLAYIAIFSVPPFSMNAVQPISVSLLALTYNMENLVLAVSSILRLLASPKQGDERGFYRTLCIYLVTYAVLAGIYNQLALITESHTIADLMVDVPFLLLALLALLLPPTQNQEIESTLHNRPLVLFVDVASPIFFTLALLTLGAVVLRQHFLTGIVAIVVGLAAYAIRTTTLQMRYIQSQQELQAARDRLEEISLKDGLTNIANRRCFDKTLESEWHRAIRTHHSLSLLLIDLDYFKNLNDSYGHPYGDRCLIEVAGALHAVALRSGDLVARYGGEEFAAILPATTRGAAEEIAARMQEAVNDLKITNETQIGGFLSVSIGICSYAFPEAGSPAILIEATDRALYKAKQSGRNRIECASMQMLNYPSFSQLGHAGGRADC